MLRGRHYGNLHYLCAKGAGPVHNGFKHREGRRAVIIMVGTDENRPPLLTGLAYTASNCRRGLHFKVCVLGAGLNGALQDFRGAGFLGHPAGGDEGDVGLGEEQLYLFIREGAAVQTDFGHLYPLQNLLNLLEFLILYTYADHLGLRW